MKPTRPKKKVSEQGSVQSVELALSILESLSGSDRAKGITQLAVELGTTKARIYRHMTTLRRNGYVVQEPETERYKLGMKLYFLGQALAERFDLIAVGREEATALRDRFGQSVLISAAQGDNLVILHVARSSTVVEIGMRVGAVFPLVATAGGRVYLAFGDVDLDKFFANRTVERHTEKTLTTPAQLRAEIQKVRQQGWASVPNQYQVGLNAVSAPIFGADGKLVASIAILGLIPEVPAVPPAEMVDALRAAAVRISNNLGWRNGTGR